MNLDQAKFILQAYRPDQAVTDSPELEEALKLLEQSEELQQWFAEDQAFDEAFREKLSGIEVPAELTDLVLTQVVEKPGQIIEIPWWKQFSVWGAAASVLLALTLILLPSKGPQAEDNTTLAIHHFAQLADQALKSSGGFNSRSQDWGQLIQYLAEHGTPAPGKLPGTVEGAPAKGCMTLRFKDKPIGVICFGKDSTAHLFVVRCKDFPELPAQKKPVYEEKPDAATLFWSESDKHYLMLSHNPEELRHYVSF
ncbi:MAG: hypothetical protein KJT03_07505 [Verrucomicrobiae bacterium]|nr:hypothetical protein [Verrucomicrobiae bacterium]